MKLKTFKDIKVKAEDKFDPIYFMPFTGGVWITLTEKQKEAVMSVLKEFKSNSRQEAIKQIKKLDGKKKDDCPDCKGLPLPCPKGFHRVIQEWIKHFFNITEEDLKVENE